MIKKELSGSSELNNLKERRNSISGSLSDETSAKIPERRIKMSQALFEPPPGDSAGVVLPFFFRCPDENWNHGTSSYSCRQCRVVLHPQISSEPHYAASTTTTTSHLYNLKLLSQTPPLQQVLTISSNKVFTFCLLTVEENQTESVNLLLPFSFKFSLLLSFFPVLAFLSNLFNG